MRRAFLLGLRRAKARHLAAMREMEDRVEDLQDEAQQRTRIEAALAERDDDEG
jgi:hypothetical protein